MKIGVLSDTCVPGKHTTLSGRIHPLFDGLDILLHLGDITELAVLSELQERFTLTFAVAGERDSAELKAYVEERRVVRFGRRRIAMIHGHQFEARHARWWVKLRRWLGQPSRSTALAGVLLGQFPGVDAILFGHTGEPYVKMHGGVLLFNPGAAAHTRGHRPSVGILDMRERTIAGRIVYLE